MQLRLQRATFGIDPASSGAHANLSTTQRYMHLSPAAKDQAIELLNSRPEVGSRREAGSDENSTPQKYNRKVVTPKGRIRLLARRKALLQPRSSYATRAICEPSGLLSRATPTTTLSKGANEVEGNLLAFDIKPSRKDLRSAG